MNRRVHELEFTMQKYQKSINTTEMMEIRLKELDKKHLHTVDIVNDAIKKFEHNIEKTIPALYNKYKVDVDWCMKEQVRVSEEARHSQSI
jgi:hypothetical protein